MVVVDHIVALVGSENHRDHVPTQKLALLRLRLVLLPMLPQALALFLDLAHADRHLRRTQRQDQHRVKDRLARIRHDLGLRSEMTLASTLPAIMLNRVVKNVLISTRL